MSAIGAPWSLARVSSSMKAAIDDKAEIRNAQFNSKRQTLIR